MATITANPAGTLNLNLPAMTTGTPGLYSIFNVFWLQLLTNDGANARAIAGLTDRVSTLETQLASALGRITALETGVGINAGTPPAWSYGPPTEI